MGGLAIGSGTYQYVACGLLAISLDPSPSPTVPTAGAVILTASAVQDNFGIMAAFGLGLDFALGSGVFIATHVAANQVSEINRREHETK
jgi:hypothetical protein